MAKVIKVAVKKGEPTVVTSVEKTVDVDDNGSVATTEEYQSQALSKKDKRRLKKELAKIQAEKKEEKQEEEERTGRR